MVNAPPTPPPTTATELQDEARETSPIVETSTSIPQISAEHYEHVLPSIIKGISDKDYQQVINIAQETDYDVLSPLFLSFYSLVYLIFLDNRQSTTVAIVAHRTSRFGSSHS